MAGICAPVGCLRAEEEAKVVDKVDVSSQATILAEVANAVLASGEAKQKIIVRISMSSESEVRVRTSSDYNQDGARGDELELSKKDGKWVVKRLAGWIS